MSRRIAFELDVFNYATSNEHELGESEAGRLPMHVRPSLERNSHIITIYEYDT